MTLLKRATIRSYDAGSHRAAVGISGSLSVWLDGIAISDAIPAAAVVVGRQCSVLFHTEDNPDDAVVISVHGGGPPGGGGGGDEIADADADTKVQVEESADEDKVRMDVAGTERFVLQDSAPHLLLTGEQRVTERLVIRNAGGQGQIFDINDNNIGTVTTNWVTMYINPQGVILGTNDNQDCTLFTGAPGAEGAAGTSGHSMRGLNFFGTVKGAGNFDDVTSVWSRSSAVFFTGVVNELTGMLVFPPAVLFGSPTINESRGLWIQEHGSVAMTDVYGIDVGALINGANRRGIHVADIAGGTIARLLELQNAMYVEGTGNWTPTANETPIIIYEGVTPTARRVQWKAGNTLGAGDKVMVLV